MTRPDATRLRSLFLWGTVCACCLLASGCGDPASSAGVANLSAPANSKDSAPVVAPAEEEQTIAAVTAVESESPPQVDQTAQTTIEPAAATADLSEKPAEAPPSDRSFQVEGPDGALRVTYDDLDLLKLLKMDPVTPDCVEKMPTWLRALNGKKVRIRGFMKPGLLNEGIPQFTFVRDTGLCCFGPKGKIYDLISVQLKPGTTTDYIELRPFDVVGTFRIEVLSYDDGFMFGLYHIDDAAIIRNVR